MERRKDGRRGGRSGRTRTDSPPHSHAHAHKHKRLLSGARPAWRFGGRGRGGHAHLVDLLYFFAGKSVGDHETVGRSPPPVEEYYLRHARREEAGGKTRVGLAGDVPAPPGIWSSICQPIGSRTEKRNHL